VAISNRRLLTLENSRVSFQWKDYRDAAKSKVMTIPAEEFIRRFLQHVLPPGLQRIRYYGFLANCHRKAKLDLCRQLLATAASQLLPQLFLCALRSRSPRPVRMDASRGTLWVMPPPPMATPASSPTTSPASSPNPGRHLGTPGRAPESVSAHPSIAAAIFRTSAISINTVHYGLSCRANAVGESPLFCWGRQFRHHA
jgi:hypothetical protein